MDQKVLWAPWRMVFLEGDAIKTPADVCIFCELLKAKDDAQNLIVARKKHCFVILNKYPYNNGHVMVVPLRHTNDFTSLAKEELAEMNSLAQTMMKTLGKCYNPQGYNTGMNLGAAAGAGIRDHLHLHVVPRWIGDTNFMPVLADTKSMPHHLTASYDLIKKHFLEIDREEK